LIKREDEKRRKRREEREEKKEKSKIRIGTVCVVV
jgi:hypothetical protein